MLDARQIAAVESRLTYAAIGDAATVRAKLAEFIALTGVDEVMVHAVAGAHVGTAVGSSPAREDTLRLLAA